MDQTARIRKPIDSEQLRQKLKLKKLAVQDSLQLRHKKALDFLKERQFDLSLIREKSAKMLGAGALTGTLLLTPAIDFKKLPMPHKLLAQAEVGISETLKSSQESLLHELKQILPEKVSPLEREQEKTLEKVIEEKVGVKARASLEGEHLNTTFGLIGAEQHLKRYPGDDLGQHIPGESDYGAENPQEILKEGIAPGLGAWGYFANSRQSLAPDLVETERWYAVVQTLYLPDWGRRQPYLRDWYKYRKVLIVNTDNGNAVVAAIADAGPAAWTGKHFGGSPEVMDYLGGARYKKGPVLVFFVDDPENNVPLGPVEYNSREISKLI